MSETKKLAPESLMMSYGYKPELSEGAIKCPVFQTSTFVFKTAEEGKNFFEIAYGKREKAAHEELGLIYSRINNPDLEILETRLKLWDEAEDAAVFGSGMSAISTVLLEFLKPGDVLLFSSPLYGGTHHFIHHTLTKYGIEPVAFSAGDSQEKIEQLIQEKNIGDRLAMIYIETPANPTNDLINIEMCAAFTQKYGSPERKILLAVDNTYMGPLWQHPLKHGADIVVYSATKYIGGHSDVIAGAVLASHALIGRVKAMRTFLGNMCSPQTGWLLLRSLETLKVRMQQQEENAKMVAGFLQHHPLVEKVYYLGFLEKGTQAYETKQQQCKGNGAMLSFDIKGGEKEAFLFLNSLKLIKLAVSLGSTESLAEHPATMTHVDIPDEEKMRLGITEKLVRLSVGIEKAEDIIWDMEQAFLNVG